MINGILGPWAVVAGADWAAYRSSVDPISGAFGIGALGLSLNGNSPFGAYSGDLSNSTVYSNANQSAALSTIVSRSTFSLRTSGTLAASFTGLDQVLGITSGGLLNSSGVLSLQGARVTVGGTALAGAQNSLYYYGNSGATTNFQSQLIDNGSGAVNLVKSGLGQLNLGPSPTLNFGQSFASAGSVSTAGTLRGLVVGMPLLTNVLNLGTGQLVTGILGGTQFSVGTPPSGASTTGANISFGLPVTQVLPSLSLTLGGTMLSVPEGSFILPGMSVTSGTGTGLVSSGGTLTVVAVSGTSVFLSGTLANSGSAQLLFAPVATVTGTAVVGTLGSNTLLVGSLGSTIGLNVGQVVTGAGIPTNTFITAISGTQITLSGTVTAAVSSGTFAAPVAQSQLTNLTAGGTTATVYSSLGMFVGQPVFGPNIPAGTTVTAILDGRRVSLSGTATGTATGNLYFGR